MNIEANHKAPGFWKKMGLSGLCATALLGAGSLYAEAGQRDPEHRCHGGEKFGHHGYEGQDFEGKGHKGGWQYHMRDHGFHPGDSGEHLQRMAERLQLSDEQRETIGNILKSAREKGGTLHARSREARAATWSAARDNAPESELRKLATAAADARVDLILHKRRTHEAVQAVLTEEQKAKMVSWQESMQECHEPHQHQHRHSGHEEDSGPAGDYE